ncbi:F-box domain-containing protein [Corynespora cassiicola Philippines]|uniref:F-box domain-containing protein n=1 Tax=Corynespora cassiicola Philippines TaxID=1448308 RepID=A0A2T2NSG6_CORCC|nr:F-box domain-containing protein [Corynespora cassiicola Philippines]
MKRARSGEEGSEERPAKASRFSTGDPFSCLSEELIVRILSFVSVPTLLVCQRVSRKFDRISVDSELWKAAYYKQYVLPKAVRIPGIKDPAVSDELRHSSKVSKWLDDAHLVKDGHKTNWKHQYRLRHNWARGKCAVSEIVVADRPPDPPLLVMLSQKGGILFTADSVSGLKAWDSKNERHLIASTLLTTPGSALPRLPTSMAIDSNEISTEHPRVVLGFEDGAFSIFALDAEHGAFECLFTHPSSTNGSLSALAYHSPYLLTMTEQNILSVYVFPKDDNTRPTLPAPQLLYSLRSHTVWPPLSLSMRTNPKSVTAAIAYALPTYLSGWTVGIQEMQLSYDGELLNSRLATATDTLSGPRPSTSQPTSISYSHPYLLVAHPDNTLSLYLVKSTSSSLSVSHRSRLWGHTSSVSGAHIGMRGKAVSVSRLGDELRVWDLEGGPANKKRARNGELSVRVQPAKLNEEGGDVPEAEKNFGLRTALEQGFDDSTVAQGWVGFDEQHVIVLREKSEGSQALVLYDFT